MYRFNRFNHQALRGARIEAGLKAEAVALLTGRTKETVINWEYGRAIPRGDVVAQLCALYGIAIDDLFIEDEGEERRLIEEAAFTSRRAQGLPEGIEDDDAVDDLVALLRPSVK